MSMKYLVFTIMSLSLITGCDNSNSNTSSTGDNSTEFNSFVLDLVQNQSSDTTEAVAINELNFEFEAEGLEDETAFDVLF